MTASAAAIELRHVTKRFGSVIALSDVSIAVNPGKCIACWATTARASRR